MASGRWGSSMVLLICALFAVSGQAATFNYKYTNGDTATHPFSDSASWEEGSVPGSGDDVVINGYSYSPSAIQQISISSATSVNSITIAATDIRLVINAVLTVQNFMCASCVLSGNSALVINSIGNFTKQDRDSVFTGISINTTSRAEVTVGTAFNLDGTTATVNNKGKWIWATRNDWSGTANSIPSINNYGQMIVISSGLKLQAKTTNYAGATLTVIEGAEVVCSRFSTSEYNPDSSFTNYGSLVIDGKFSVGSTCPWTMAAGTMKGTGVLYGLAYATYAPVVMTFNVKVDTTVKLEIESYCTIAGTGDLRFQSFQSTSGLILKGTGKFNVVSWENTGASYNLNSGVGYLIGRNITIEQNWSYSQGLSGGTLNLVNAFIVTLPGVEGIFRGGSNLFNCSTNCGIVNYGNITSATALTYASIYVPIFNYGGIIVPDIDVTGEPLVSQYWEGGGYFDGYAHSKATTFDSQTANQFGESAFGFGASGLTFGPNAYLDGGFYEFAKIAPCTYATDTDACLLEGSYYWYGLKYGSILQLDGCAFQIMAKGVVFPRYIALNGFIFGPYNLTVTDGLRTDNGYNLYWYIDGTSVVVTNSWEFSVGQTSFRNGGNFIVQKGATLKVTGQLTGSSNNDDSSGIGIYNYGNTMLVFPQDYRNPDFTQIFYNYNNMSLVTTVTKSSADKGLTIRLGSFVNYGVLNMNIYSATDYDVLDYSAYYHDNCVFSGTINFVFRYTPQIGTVYTVIDGPSSSFCSGNFKVTIQGAPTGSVGVIFYDISNSPYANTIEQLNLCSSSNTTCSSYVPPNHSAATTTTSGSNPSSNSGSSANTGATTRRSGTTGEDSSDASVVATMSVVVIGCLLALFV
eukprot:TRINITY_DN1386_c1_g1_i1.p1 TRINITY_DN1386_c1_g1~~TRINITY_DN1386_c1_g1_i1.p1  ORF type:complete len:859 (-),score=184.76 TRINITY_DN1386_c1_g1_i1:99-2675(-)